MMAARRYQQGFTLLELLVALSIFTLIGMGGNIFLQSVIKSREVAKKHSERITQLQKAMVIVTQDFIQMENPAAAVPTGNYLLTFTRHGWNNPLLQNRSDRLAVAYKLEASRLLRYYWPAERPAITPQTQLLLDGVSDFDVKPLPPHMFELSFHMQPFGTIRRVIEVPDP